MTNSASTNTVPKYDSVKESRRFIRNLIWVLVVGLLFLGGQGVRYYLNKSQIADIRNETEKLYKSVLGEDIGSSPFGRLQFEHGKLMASERIGLDPLSMLAALSGPADESLRIEGMSLTGVQGRVRGVFAGDQTAFNDYFNELTDSDHYLFSLYKSDEFGESIAFSLTVEPK